MIEVDSLTKRFGPHTVVDRVSFSVAKGEVLGFLGPNGAGKSTTMRMITGFLPPSAGRAVVCGFDVAAQPIEAKRRIGYLPEGAPLYGDMTPRTLLGFFAEIRGVASGHRRARIAEAVERVAIGEVMEQRIDTLSKGFKRRVGLAQAIVHDPEVLILDEPTDGLDPNQKHEVRSLLRGMAGEKAIIISTHILEEVEAVCARAVIIARGRVLADATPQALMARSPRHNAVALRVEEGLAAGLSAALGELAGVARVETMETANGSARLLVVPNDGRSLLDEVRGVIARKDIAVDALAVEPGRLDDVFRDITAGT
jgi:ABC-2 type transport system ATP-binding protein